MHRLLQNVTDCNTVTMKILPKLLKQLEQLKAKKGLFVIISYRIQESNHILLCTQTRLKNSIVNLQGGNHSL